MGRSVPGRPRQHLSDASGRVGRILKKPGDKVGQGELLATLDMTSLELMQKQARAAMAVAQTAYQNASLNAERMKKMLENKAISQMQYREHSAGAGRRRYPAKSAKANLDLVDYTAKNAYMKAPFAGIIAAKNMEEGDMINPMMGMGQSILTLMDLSKVWKVTVGCPGRGDREDQARPGMPGQDRRAPAKLLPAKYIPRTWLPTRSPRPSRSRSRSTTRK